MANEQLSEVLRDFARTMATDFPIQRILDHLVKRIVEIMPVTAAGVTLISADVGPRYVAASNASALRFERLQTDTDEGPCLEAYRTAKAISVPDLRAEARFPIFAPRALDAGLAAVFTFPLHHGDLQLGALDLYRDTPGSLSFESMSAAQTLADVAAAYLLNAQARADLQDSSDRSREAALHDPLTGLPNRVLMLERLRHASLRARRSSHISAVFVIDLDRFKNVNDSYGHRVGDELLVAVAERLPHVLRPGDTVARMSGDEFAILCEDLEHPSEADDIGVRIGAALGRAFVLSENAVSLTASIGVAFTRRGNETPGQLLHDADLAMYRMKREISGGRHVIDPRELHLAEDQADLELALPGALSRGELHLGYDPIVAAVDGQLTGVEALLRWEYPGRGLVYPTALMPLAERCGLMAEIGGWVLDQAWADRRRWQRLRTDGVSLSVNISAQQFLSIGFAGSVAALIDTGSSDPQWLTLQLHENVFVRDPDRALVVLNELKDIGVRLALDDFGTGDSSLGYLMSHPVDTIKVDRAFVANLGRNPASKTILASVIQLAHSLGMAVVSKGVETAEQHRTLAGLGCDSCQGFYFAAPMPAASVESLIRPCVDGSLQCLPGSPPTDRA
jgi:diguanylate cyclase (GGDEF)-like protein